VRPRIVLLAGLCASAVLALPAAAAGQTVQAVDGDGTTTNPPRWTPADVTVRAGETVTWSFAGTTGLHNVESRGANWTFRNGGAAVAPPPASHRFDAPGIYTTRRR
jgi:plastocyanin